MKRLLKAEICSSSLKGSELCALSEMLFYSLWTAITDGIVPVHYDVVITGYEMYVMRLLAGLRYEVLIGVFAVIFCITVSICKSHADTYVFIAVFRRSQIFLAKAAAFFAGVLPIVLLAYLW